MAYTNIKLIKAEKTYNVDVYSKELTVVKVKDNRWLVANPQGEVVKSCLSEAQALKYCEKVENRRYNGNMFGYRFGKSICPDTIEERTQEVWGGIYTTKNVHFKDAHYWNGTVVNVETGEESTDVRMDYFLNYMRIPKGLETDLAVSMTKAEGVRF